MIMKTKKIKTKLKWNKINLISMEYGLGSNCRIPLLHMSKRKVFIEVTNERINEFSFAYMCNPHLHIKKNVYRTSKNMFKSHIWFRYGQTD